MNGICNMVVLKLLQYQTLAYLQSQLIKMKIGDSFGIRTSRYAFLIENGSIVKEFKNPFIEGVLEEI